jgi:hypothetical protein
VRDKVRSSRAARAPLSSTDRRLHVSTIRYFVRILAAIAATSVVMAASGDGFPSGSSTPEGAASDFARAFIKRDANMFKSIVLQPFGGGESRKKYENFLTETAAAIAEESRRPADRGPREIARVFASRSMTRSSPASYAYATFNFADVKFVDVVVTMYGGGTTTNRTLVVKDSAGLWHVHPAPGIHPMLSVGLNDEPPSKVELSREADRR